MKILWVSANRFGYALLKEAIKLKHCNLKAIITLRENTNIIMYDGIKIEKWHDFGVDVHKVEKIENSEGLIKSLLPDLIVICGWRQILKGNILRIPPNGVIGFHPTLLPFGRGSAPIINTLLRGERESGVTMFYMDKGLDSGDIIGQAKFKINKTDHADDVYAKVIRSGKKLIRNYMPLVIARKVSRIPQNNSKAFSFDKPKLRNNKIDFEKESLEMVYKKIKALSKPYCGAYVEKDGRRLILWKAELQEMR
jgi:methionyl-tRNA formyltransferase